MLNPVATKANLRDAKYEDRKHWQNMGIPENDKQN